MKKRYLQDRVESDLNKKMVFVSGPRQVGKTTLDIEKCGNEMQKTALKLIQQNPDIGAIVLECTNMPPYAQIVHTATGGLPVFDMVTMINYAHSTIRYK